MNSHSDRSVWEALSLPLAVGDIGATGLFSLGGLASLILAVNTLINSPAGQALIAWARRQLSSKESRA